MFHAELINAGLSERQGSGPSSSTTFAMAASVECPEASGFGKLYVDECPYLPFKDIYHLRISTI